MNARLAMTCLAAAALFAPGAYANDTKTSATGAKTEKVKEVMDDAAITTKIKAEFAKDKQVSALNIHVDTDHGVVKLSGNAKSKAEADKAVEIAKGTKGVASVSNGIKVGTASAKY